MRISVLAAGFMVSVFAAPSAWAETDFEAIMHGKDLVEANCSRCHGVGLKDKSSEAKAPVFRELAKRYPIDALEEAFAEGIVTGHPGMPEFEATPKQIGDIVAYISSIQDEQSQ